MTKVGSVIYSHVYTTIVCFQLEQEGIYIYIKYAECMIAQKYQAKILPNEILACHVVLYKI